LRFTHVRRMRGSEKIDTNEGGRKGEKRTWNKMPGISPSGDPARQQTEGGILRLRGCRPEQPPKRHRRKVPSVVNPRPPSLRSSERQEPRDGSCPSETRRFSGEEGPRRVNKEKTPITGQERLPPGILFLRPLGISECCAVI
jgi:hypothetical protein